MQEPDHPREIEWKSYAIDFEGLIELLRESPREGATNLRGQFVMASWPRDFVACRSGFRAERLIPSFFMRLRRVLGCRSRIFAAPRSPSITQSVFCRTLTMWRFSTCSSEEEPVIEIASSDLWRSKSEPG